MLRYHPSAPSYTTPPSMPLPPPDFASTPPLRPARIDVHPGLAGKNSIRVIAVWEAVKGVLVLLAGGVAVYIFRPDDEHTIEEFVGHFHLNPAGHTSHIFQRALEHLQDTHLVLLASGALLYALLRFVEAYGLWFEKRWGWMLGIASAGLYLPLEIREMVTRFTWTSVGLFIVNMGIVALLWRNRTRHGAAAP